MTDSDASQATDRVAQMLSSCATPDTVMPAAALYNEGWMLRLLLDWWATHPGIEHPLAFAPGARWYSEVLLPSQFLPRKRGDELGESWTHADGIVGHFQIAEGRGDIKLDHDAKQLLVIEGKMFSALSKGTKRATMFDQAARNVACIAEVVHRSRNGATSLQRLGFVVLAPAQQIGAGVFGDLCRKENIAAKVHDRVTAYGTEKSNWQKDVFLPILERTVISLLSWEAVLEVIEHHDAAGAEVLRRFYAKCLAFNRRPSPSESVG